MLLIARLRAWNGLIGQFVPLSQNVCGTENFAMSELLNPMAPNDAGLVSGESAAVHTRRNLQAQLGLTFAAFIFGSTFIVMKDAVRVMAPLPFLSLRFLVGALALGGVLLVRKPMAPSRSDVGRFALPAGVALLSGYAFQTIGLQYTTGSVSAFITYLLVVFVPLFVLVLTRVLPPPLVLLGVLIAFIGLFLISGSGGVKLGKGEFLTLLCAIGFASHIMTLDRVGKRIDTLWLAFIQMVVVAVGCGAMGLVTGGWVLNAKVILAAVSLGIMASAVAFFLQTWAQRRLEPTRTALLLMLEPVFAAIAGYFIAHDHLGLRGIVGGVLILLGVVAAELGTAYAKR
jgi:drug/metabolite transporter (DMT)-like permease